MPTIDIEPLKHALQPVQEAEAAYQAAYAAVRTAAPMNKGEALNKAKKAQHGYHDACRRLCSYVRQAVDNEEAVILLARRMGLMEGDKATRPTSEPEGTGISDEPFLATRIPCRYHRLCSGHLDPAQPLQGNLCPACFETLDGDYEQ